jgi:hypothetical protein
MKQPEAGICRDTNEPANTLISWPTFWRIWAKTYWGLGQNSRHVGTTVACYIWYSYPIFNSCPAVSQHHQHSSRLQDSLGKKKKHLQTTSGAIRLYAGNPLAQPLLPWLRSDCENWSLETWADEFPLRFWVLMGILTMVYPRYIMIYLELMVWKPKKTVPSQS